VHLALLVRRPFLLVWRQLVLLLVVVWQLERSLPQPLLLLRLLPLGMDYSNYLKTDFSCMLPQA